MIKVGLESTRIILTRGRQTTTWVRFVLCHLLCSIVENVYVYWRINFPSPITPVYYDFSNQCVLEDRMGAVGWTIEPPIHSHQIGNMLMTRSGFSVNYWSFELNYWVLNITCNNTYLLSSPGIAIRREAVPLATPLQAPVVLQAASVATQLSIVMSQAVLTLVR